MINFISIHTEYFWNANQKIKEGHSIINHMGGVEGTYIDIVWVVRLHLRPFIIQNLIIYLMGGGVS